MTGQGFCSMASKRMAALIQRAERRALLCVPSVRADVAGALTEAASRLGTANVRVVLDCDEEVFRLGYGDISALRALKEAGIDVRHCPGLRVGLLIIDERGWTFTPTALYVQAEVHSDETPNAVELCGSDLKRLAAILCPEAAAPATDANDESQPVPAIGQTPLDEETIARVEQALEVAPPIRFDIARQVRVFQPYIQYVEITLRGCSIQRHRVTIPKTIQRLGSAKDIENRLRTTFELIEKSSELSSKAIDDELNQLRDNFTRPLGKPWGRVLLRSVRPLLDQRVAEFRKKLGEHKKKVQTELSKKLAESRSQVVEYYLPLVRDKPPDALLGQLMTPKLRDEDLRTWLDAELDRVFPSSEDLLKEMELDVQFRDVTYETLNQPGFAEALKKAYPHVDWDKPFDEFRAAKEHEPQDKP